MFICVQDDEEDFEHLNDEDEFEGFDKERTPKKSHEQPPDLKITKVDDHAHIVFVSDKLYALTCLIVTVSFVRPTGSI